MLNVTNLRVMFGLMAIAALLAVPARAEDVFIEAENSPSHTFTDVADFESIVSGGKILRLWNEADPLGEGYLAEWRFTIKSPGRYHVWLGASLPSATSSFWWRMDDRAWTHVAQDVGGGAAYGVSGVMAWMRLTTAVLTGGEHELAIRVNERRTGLERAYLLYLDAILITSRDVTPNGLVTPQDVPRLEPKDIPPKPVRRAGKPGPRLTLGSSVMDDRGNRTLKSLGFTLLQTDSDHLTVNEVSPGRWDWKSADAGLEACRRAGVKWQYFPHFHWPPEWYRKSDRFAPCTGLRTGRKLACISIWSPDRLNWLDHCYSALAAKYGAEISAIYVGVHGDFGETLFPMGWHPEEKARFGEEGAGYCDFWCGDPSALADFRKFARNRYGGLKKINAAWGTGFASVDLIDYPPAARGPSTDVTSSPQVRRYWLDFVEWYYDSMTRFTQEVCRIARKRFPKTLLALPVGGGEEAVVYAQDNTALPKVAANLGVHVRSTHGGFQPFAANCASMLKRIATACKFYGAPFWTEPPNVLKPEQEVSRFMETVSCGSWGFWDWGANPLGSVDTFREYAAFLTREKPIVDVALFFPTTDHRLHPTSGYPNRLAKMGADMRDAMDYDILDEGLIADGALARYRVLFWLEGSFIEEKTLSKIAEWVEHGGVLLKFGADAPRTVEGSTALGRRLLGLTDRTHLTETEAPARIVVKKPAFLRHTAAYKDRAADTVAAGLHRRAVVLAAVADRPAAWAVRLGNGWTLVWAGQSENANARRTFYELASDVVYNLSRLDYTKLNALEVDSEWDGVYATLLANGEVMLYNSSGEPRTKNVGGSRLTLPPHSLRSSLAAVVVPARCAAAHDMPAESRSKLEGVFRRTADILWDDTEIAWHAGRHDVCINMHRLITEMDPTFIESYDVGAWLLDSAGRRQEAIAFYNKGIAANPDRYELYFDLGMLYYGGKDHSNAELNFSAAVDRSAPPSVWKMLAHTQEKLGKLSEALAAWEKVRQMNPSDPVIEPNASRIRLKLEKQSR